MQTLLVNCLLVLLFVLLGGLFAASEIALVSLRPGQLRALEETGGRRGRAVARLLRDQNSFLSAVQVGVTLAGFFSASFGAAQISPSVTPLLEGLGLGHATAASVAFVLVTVVVAYLSLVLGELVPKRLAMQSAQAVALVLGPPLALLSTALRPVIWFLGASCNVVLRLLGRDPHAREEEMAPEELRGLVAESTHLGEVERRVVVDVLGVESRRVSEVMTPRTEVVFLRADLRLDEAVAAVHDGDYSRYPVTGDSADEVLGYVHVRDLLRPPAGATRLGQLARRITVLPESKPVLDALAQLRADRDHIALVVDEYGGTDGIVTLEDLLEEFVGEIADEFDAEHPASVQDRDGESVPGLLSRAEVSRELGVELPDGAFDTLAGYVAARLGRVPAVGDRCALGPLQLEVTDLDGRRVDRIVVHRSVLVDATAEQVQA